MFKDDKMIGLLTALVLMVAFGTVMQKAGGLNEILDTLSGVQDDRLRLVDDQVTVRTNTLVRLKVLDNDKGLAPEQRKGLAVVRAPDCGRVFVQEGTLQYFPEAACVGERRLVYTVPDIGPDGAATVVLRVIGDGDAEPAPAMASAAQQAVEKVALAKAPQAMPAMVERVVEKPAKAAPAKTPPAPQTAAASVEAGTSRTTASHGTNAAVKNVRSEARIVPEAQPVQVPSPAAVETSADQRVARVEPSAPQPTVVRAASLVRDPVAPPSVPADLAAPSLDADAGAEVALAALDVPGSPAEDLTWPGLLPSEPVASSIGGSGVMIAVLERREPPKAELPAPRAPAVQEPDLGEILVLAAAKPDAPVPVSLGSEVLAGQGGEPGNALSGLPMDRNLPPRPRPRIVPEMPEQPEQQPALLARLSPAETEAVPVSVTQPAPASTPEQEPQELIAALPPAEAACVAPPSTAIDIKRGARTHLHVVAPCQADTVAELRYSGLSFAVPLDAEGKGGITALGFEANAAALLTFVDGTQVDFDLPFRSIARIQRVALVWDQPVSLELNALEFGAGLRSAGHVYREHPRSFSQVRRAGGGFLNRFRSAGGVGQNVEVYTFWNRAGSSSGVVRLLIDFASRSRDRLEGTCDSGPLASPQYLVMRSDGGQMTGPISRRLVAVSCLEVGGDMGDERLISDGIDDLIIR